MCNLTFGSLDSISLGSISYNFPKGESGSRDTLNIGLLFLGVNFPKSESGSILAENRVWCGCFFLAPKKNNKIIMVILISHYSLPGGFFSDFSGILRLCLLGGVSCCWVSRVFVLKGFFCLFGCLELLTFDTLVLGDGDFFWLFFFGT